MRSDSIFIINYASGVKKELCEIDYVSKLRSKACLRAYKDYPAAKIVLGAGMSYATNDCGTLADNIKNYLLLMGVKDENILINAKGYNTLTETEAAFKFIKNKRNFKIICTTSFTHSFRVFCIWFFRFGIIPKFYLTHYITSPKYIVHEILGIPVDILKSIYSRF